MPVMTRDSRSNPILFAPTTLMRHTLLALSLAAAGVSAVDAQTTAPDSVRAPAQDEVQVPGATISVRPLGPIEAKSARPIGTVNTLRALSNGSVFINDGQRREILLFDESLRLTRVVADTMEAPLPYGQRNLGLLPYVNDSTLIVHPTSLALLVLNARGEMVRVMSFPRTRDINVLASANFGTHAFDAKGRLIYRPQQPGGAAPGVPFGGGDSRSTRPAAATTPPAATAATASAADSSRSAQTAPSAAEIRRQVAAVAEDRFPSGNSAQISVAGVRRTRSFNNRNLPDSVPILRVDFDTRKIDTVTFMRVTNPKFEMKQTEDGGTQVNVKMNPLPQNDDWALAADGSVAVVRVLDYRVDWFKSDGTVDRSEPLPFDWKRITDDDKAHLVDSLKDAAKVATERAEQLLGGPNGFRPGFEPVEPELLPDYYPPLRAGTTLADYEGNLWLLPATSTLVSPLDVLVQGTAGVAADSGPPGLVYDVVDRSGKIVERVQIPAGRTVAGFGPDGIVYLLDRTGRELFLEKARRTRP